MRRLAQFLKRFRNFAFFLLLQSLLLGLFFNSKNYHKAQFLNTSSAVTGWMVEQEHAIANYMRLKKVSDSLLKENALLHALLPQRFYRLQHRTYVVNDTLSEQHYRYIPAQVINSSNNKRNNYLTINRGESSGIRREMGVIAPNGIVGFVVDVSAHYAIVRTVLSENINISVKLKRNNKYWLIKWNGEDNAVVQLHGVTKSSDIQKGDEIVARGNRGIFPINETVGVVHEISSEGTASKVDVDVQLAVNFGSVYHVYVVENFLKEEQMDLESTFFRQDG